jgi:hypothetical protein
MSTIQGLMKFEIRKTKSFRLPVTSRENSNVRQDATKYKYLNDTPQGLAIVREVGIRGCRAKMPE